MRRRSWLDEEAVEHTERNRWHGEEVHRRNRFPMVSKEGEPTFGRVKISRRSFHPTGDRSLGELKTEHEEFPMYPRRSPGWVLGNHLEDQLPNPPSASVFFQPASGLWRSTSNTFENLSGANGLRFQA
jgi:hypothetical protein